MPELPEVETTLRGIQPHIQGQRINQVIIRHYGLRWPIPRNISDKLTKKTISQTERRAKYLLFNVSGGTFVIHLGMSGSLRIVTPDIPPKKHDHVDIILANNKVLRFTDPRRFGALLWIEHDVTQHALFKDLGPEPLTSDFSASYLWKKAQGRAVPIKSFIMNNHIVVGVGNIYATEALFLAGINPKTQAKKVSKESFIKLTKAIKLILRKAIKKGGTTLKDFVNSNGKPGYFSQQLKVYGRTGLPCVNCKSPLKAIRIGQRNTVYCEECQPL